MKRNSTRSSVSNIVLREYERSDITIEGIDDQLIEDLSKYVEFIPIGKDSYTISARSYVGLIKLREDLLVNVLPKIEMNNLFIMLNYVYDFPLDLFEDVAALRESRQLVRFLIRIFIDRVRGLFYRSFRKSYLTIQENRKTLKGRILIKENLKHNRFHLERIYCEYDDFTEDIMINRIIKYSLFLLFHLDDGEFTRELRHLFSLFKNVTLYSVSVTDIDSVKYSRLNEAYKPVHMLCRLFIQNIFVSHKLGEQKMFCFLVDMNRLFEEFVRSILRRFSPYKVVGHPRQKYLDETENVKIKPDIRFVEGQTTVLVADCKYKKLKKLEDDDQNAQVINSDMYQILAYMIGYNQRRGMLIYPKGEVQKEIETVIDLDGISRKIFVKPIDLNDIKEENLQAFTREVENVISG